MMTPINRMVCLVSGYLLLPAMTYADSWSLTQTVTINSAMTLSQTNTNNAIVGANVIRLDSSTGVVTTANQAMTTNGNDLTLSQDGASSSHQAVNYLSAAHIDSASQTVSQVDQVLFEQKNGSTNNIQGLNLALGTGSGIQIDALTQTVSANSVTFDGAGSGNIQAGNYIQADAVSTVAGNVVQDFNVSGVVSYIQTGTNNLQAGNVVIKNTPSFTGNVTQNFSAGNVIATFSAAEGNNSIKAANYFAQKI